MTRNVRPWLALSHLVNPPNQAELDAQWKSRGFFKSVKIFFFWIPSCYPAANLLVKFFVRVSWIFLVLSTIASNVFSIKFPLELTATIFLPWMIRIFYSVISWVNCWVNSAVDFAVNFLWILRGFFVPIYYLFYQWKTGRKNHAKFTGNSRQNSHPNSLQNFVN